MQLKALMECSFHDAVAAWNAGFQDYQVNLTMTVRPFLSRMVHEGLSPEYSFLAYDGDRPVGILLSGIVEHEEGKEAYNGGTAVDPDYRDKGVGYLLVKAALDKYEEEGADIATLEAISTNDRAIHMYEKHNYGIVDHLAMMGKKGERTKGDGTLRMAKLTNSQLDGIDFHDEDIPWQTRILHIKGAEAFAFYDDHLVGYTVITQAFGESGNRERVLIYQLEAADLNETSYASLLQTLYQEFPADHYSVVNIRKSHPLYEVLLQEGFETKIEQVWMKRKMNLT
ncbi:GNAT family N-acetyltransferase [Thalassobacillus hwangdonensis]|uniref:GNAT family N-acetyltransferase n=1 Tax=Thalassobacillus hwangdonensis TaxID=546108 RepID=A0ABW3L2H9_9BACI